VLLDLCATSKATQTVVGVANQAVKVRTNRAFRSGQGNLPANKVLCLGANLLVWREVQVSGPVYNLAVCVVGFLCTERGPTNQALEHDGANAPPITAVVVALAAEDLGSNIVGSTDGRVGELTTRFAPGVDLMAVADSQLDLVEGD